MTRFIKPFQNFHPAQATPQPADSPRISLQDSVVTATYKMSGGNPGALTAMMDLLKSGPGGIHYILLLDTYGIYGSDIYVLWSDICARDIKKMISVLTATQMGKFSSAILKDACSRQDYSGREMIPVDELHAQMTNA